MAGGCTAKRRLLGGGVVAPEGGVEKSGGAPMRVTMGGAPPPFHTNGGPAINHGAYPPCRHGVGEGLLSHTVLCDALQVLQQVVISTPRRYGKSFSVAMFVAACMYAIPGFSIVVFSVAQRQSDMLMGHIRAFFDTLPGAKERYKVKNSELFEVYDSRGGIATLRCLPGRSETTRGVGANMIILEEAAFINEKIFYDVIVPLLGVKDTVLIGISTPPKDGFNYYLSLFDCNDANGEPIFKIEKVQLQCKACEEKQVTKCPHIKVPEPKWKTSSRKDIQKRIYAKNPDVYRREVEGLAVTVDVYVFHGQYIDALMKQTQSPESPLAPSTLINFVFIGIDPSGGGNGSDTAFIALTFRPVDFHPVILGVASVRMTNAVMQKEIDALLEFCKKLRSIRVLSAAVFVFLIEANHCWVRAKDLANWAAKFQPCEVVSEKMIDNHPVPGVWTTAFHKDQANKHANMWLQQNYMHILPVAHKEHPLVLLEDPETIVRKFGDQLRMYRQKTYTPADASKESKVAYTGKGAGMCDDMVMAWEIALWWGANFLNESSVDKYKQPRVNVVVQSHPDMVSARSQHRNAA